jgi:tRNA A-37 threonylcarbamoyl transferase component Bud32
LMEEIPGAVDLGHWQGAGRHAAQAVAVLVGKLHNEGFRHRDLKETNIVFDHAGRAFLLDLEGLDYLKAVSNRRAAADLARLARAAQGLPQFSSTDRRCFLRCYCKTRGIRPGALRVS